MVCENPSVKASVVYGFGTSAEGDFPSGRLRGLTARQLIGEVASRPQGTEAAGRVARVLHEIIASGRMIDVEVSAGTRDVDQAGEPIELDDPVVPANLGPADEIETLRLEVFGPPSRAMVAYDGRCEHRFGLVGPRPPCVHS